MAHAVHCLGQRLGQAHRTAAVALEQMQGHALGRLLPDARQNAQGVDQVANQWAEAHGTPTDW
jgi:hypothetical protein